METENSIFNIVGIDFWFSFDETSSNSILINESYTYFIFPRGYQFHILFFVPLPVITSLQFKYNEVTEK